MSAKIYLLHGWSYKLERWDGVLSLLAKAGLEVEPLKIPGLTDGTDRAWTLDDYLDWLQKSTGDHKQVVLIGHSNGGRLAIAYAVRHPEKVKQLILIDSAGIYPRGLTIRLKRAIFGTLAKVGKRLTQSKRLRRLLYQAARESNYHQATPAMRQTMANLIEADLRHQLGQVQAPTTLIWGEKDRSTPLSDGKIMLANIPQANLTVIAGAGHSPHVSHPDQLAKLLVQALK